MPCQAYKAFLFLLVILVGSLIMLLIYGGKQSLNGKNDSLILVHVLMRHGEKNPDKSSLYLSSPYYNESFYPDGYGQLTKKGRYQVYELGVALRQRYNNFLGDIWNIKHVDAWSTSYNRTKMSLQLALAGLFPPKSSQSWVLNWLPIPFNFLPFQQDKELLPYYACPRYDKLTKILYQRPEIKQYLQRYNKSFEILANHTGLQIDVTIGFNQYTGFRILDELGFPLESWIPEIYPEPLHSMVIDMYYLMTNTTELRRIISGFLLKRIVTTSQEKITNKLVPPERKMFIYSVHEMNIATMLLTLGTQTHLSEIPPCGSYLLMEVHKIDGIYGIKIFYENYGKNSPVQLKIKGCDHFCPFDEFFKITKRFLPESDEECYCVDD
ncbi:venom acid phosphatase Acph-1-like [Anthonomus grandis grandis]|uniref:venom acid phosphatase Acph-1-like n=1 Tax=Anthonomus grandis grandis TaxID=2921223 RepID=UPI002165E8DF|nr:venom acid phosphatase Acph-1-like [Anthonomus grandis grandis]